MKRLTILFILGSVGQFLWAQCPGGYSYKRSITVASGQVTGTLSNFPMLVLNPTTSLKTVANGGRLTSSSGYDAAFYTGGGSLLNFELVGHGGASTTYSGTTGNAEFWVNVASMTTGSQVYLCYGNAAITTYQGNDAGTWNSAYKLVAHLNNGSTLSVADSTGNNTPTNVGVSAATGAIDGGITVGGGGDGLYVNLGSNAAIQSGVFTYQSWVNANGTTYPYNDIIGSSAPSGGVEWGVESNGATRLLIQDIAVLCSGSPGSVPITGWHLMTATYNSGSGACNIYVDGANVASGTNVQTFTFASAWLGARYSDGVAISDWYGSLDEFRMMNAVQTPTWIAAEFNNQSAPGTFYAVGAETSGGGGTASFTASPRAMPTSNPANIVVTLTGSYTSWVNGTTVMTATGVSGTSCGAVTVTSLTAATMICTTGATAGTLTITESVTGTSSVAVSVGLGGGITGWVMAQ